MRLLPTALLAVCVPLIVSSVPCAGQNDKDHSFYTVSGYDEAADPFDHLKLTTELALREGKRILLQVGGEWCGWCHRLDQFIQDHPAILEKLRSNYLIMKVTYSAKNQNRPFLSQYPKIPGYPHLYVLESDGTFLHSQGTLELEEGKSYNERAILDFLAEWAPVSSRSQGTTPESFEAWSDSAAAIRAYMAGQVLERSDKLLIVVSAIALQTPDSLLGTVMRMVMVYADDCIGGLPVLHGRRAASSLDWRLNRRATVVSDTLRLRAPLPALGARTCKLYFALLDSHGEVRSRLATREPVAVVGSAGY